MKFSNKVIAIVTGVIFALGGAVSAQAEGTPTTVTVVWNIPGGVAVDGHHFDAPQTLYSQTPGTLLNDVAVPTTCGTAYQVDVYNVSDGTTALLAGGVLNGSHDPFEDLIAGGDGVAYKLVQNEECPQEVPVITQTITFTDHTCKTVGSVDAPIVKGVHLSATMVGSVNGTSENFPGGAFFATDDGSATGVPFIGTITITATAEDGYTLGDSVTSWSHVFKTASGCEIVVTTPTATTPVQELAHTGVMTGWLLPVALGFLLLGAGFMVYRKVHA